MRYANILFDGRRRLATSEGEHGYALFAPGLELQDVIANEGLRPVAFAEATECELLAPLRPGKVIGVGLNYQETVVAMGLELPTEPYLFGKFPSSIIGPTDAIEFDPLVTQRVDWEVELGVVIGSGGRAIEIQDALDAVFGYTTANDVSARDLQATDGQWVRGKSLDTFCPIGPFVVDRSEVPDPSGLRLRTWVNGELMQDGSTSDLVFGVPELVAYCSRFFTLDPGDLILTGTPPGCGDYLQPPRHLRAGDIVVAEVDGIGRLTNPVRARPEGDPATVRASRSRPEHDQTSG